MKSDIKVTLTKMNDFDELIVKETIYEDDEVKIFYGSHKCTELIIHQLPICSFFTNDLINYLKNVLFLKTINHENLLKMYGFSNTKDYLYIEYINDDNIKMINLKIMNDLEKSKMIRNIAEGLKILHQYNITTYRVKPTSIFVNEKGIYLFGLFQPKMMIINEKEDEMLPFQSMPDEKCDVYQFGVLLCTILTNMTQEEIMKLVWDFKEIEMKETLITELCKKCMSFDIHTSLTFVDITKELNNITNNNLFEPIDTKPKTINTNEINDLIPTSIPSITTIASYSLDSDKQISDKKTVISNDININDIIKNYALTTNNYFMKYLYAMILLQNKDIMNSIKYLEECSKMDYPQAQNNLAKILFKKDKARAMSLFKRSAEQRYVIAEKNYAHILNAENHRDIAMKYMKDAADRGLIEAMCMYNSMLVEVDRHEGYKYIVKAARRGDETAIHMAGLAYEKGVLFPKNDFMMLSYWRIGAALGSPLSINNLGKNTDSPEESVKLWMKSAEMGTRQAQYNLALSYILGKGCERNAEKAFYWMKKAADQKLPPAMTNLGLMYIDGIGCEKNEKLGQILCRKGAERRLELSNIV